LNIRKTLAYSLGFFFGPGRPRDLGSVWPFVRLLPGFGPGTPFRRGVSGAPVAGVEFASEPLSADDGRTGSSEEEVGEDRLMSVWVLVNWARELDDSLRTTVKEEFFPRRLFGVPAGIVACCH